MAAKWQGSKWIRPERRTRIYARDKYRCRHCGCRVAAFSDPDRKRLHRAIAVLDHIKPRSRGGTNEDSNLQTSCRTCNCSKQHKVHKLHRPYSVGAMYHPDSVRQSVASVVDSLIKSVLTHKEADKVFQHIANGV